MMQQNSSLQQLDIDVADANATLPGQPEPAVPAEHEGFENLPTVLKKLQKWGDYEAFGDVVQPTRFIPCKTPLSRAILASWSLPEAPKHRLTVPELLEAQQARSRDVGMILDLSNHDCLYTADLPASLDYIHIKLVAKELPPPDFVSKVIAAADSFWQDHPDKYICVHCAYGFNRTGFVLCCYLIERCGLSVTEALLAFSSARPPGVKHEQFKAELRSRYEPSLCKHLPASGSRSSSCLRWASSCQRSMNSNSGLDQSLEVDAQEAAAYPEPCPSVGNSSSTTTATGHTARKPPLPTSSSFQTLAAMTPSPDSHPYACACAGRDADDVEQGDHPPRSEGDFRAGDRALTRNASGSYIEARSLLRNQFSQHSFLSLQSTTDLGEDTLAPGNLSLRSDDSHIHLGSDVDQTPTHSGTHARTQRRISSRSVDWTPLSENESLGANERLIFQGLTAHLNGLINPSELQHVLQDAGHVNPQDMGSTGVTTVAPAAGAVDSRSPERIRACPDFTRKSLGDINWEDGAAAGNVCVEGFASDAVRGHECREQQRRSSGCVAALEPCLGRVSIDEYVGARAGPASGALPVLNQQQPAEQHCTTATQGNPRSNRQAQIMQGKTHTDAVDDHPGRSQESRGFEGFVLQSMHSVRQQMTRNTATNARTSSDQVTRT